MKVYGLDFTSAPSKSKRLTLALCHLNEDILSVEKLEDLNTEKDGDYQKFWEWLNGSECHGNEWIAGVDFPFGMPIEAIERFGWLENVKEPSWSLYVESLYKKANNELESFRKEIESWKKSGKSGDDKRVFLLRQTDKLSGFAGSTPSSPMKVHHQCNPPVGRMFFQGAKKLKDSGVCIPPVRWNDCKRIVVESYPRLVADKFIPGGKYKEGKNLSSSREAIINGLSKANEYQITVSFRSEKDRDACVDDEQGDTLDSVLSAVQAAWAYQSEQKSLGSLRRTQRYGVPVFTVGYLNNLVALEGWIVDPLLLRSFKATEATY